MGLDAAVAIALAGALLPPAVLMAATWTWLFRREATGLYWTAVGLGAGAVFAAAALQIPVLLVTIADGSRAFVPMAVFLAVVSLIEEALKVAGWLLAFLMFRRPMSLRPGLCVGAAVIVALALAAIENVLFNIGITLRQREVFWEMIAARALTSVPLHATTGLIIGLFAWRVFVRRRRRPADWIGLIGLPVLLHAAFNILQVAGGLSRHSRELMEIDGAQWLGIAVAGALVWVAAGLALAWLTRLRRAARRPLGQR